MEVLAAWTLFFLIFFVSIFFLTQPAQPMFLHFVQFLWRKPQYSIAFSIYLFWDAKINVERMWICTYNWPSATAIGPHWLPIVNHPHQYLWLEIDYRASTVNKLMDFYLFFSRGEIIISSLCKTSLLWETLFLLYFPLLPLPVNLACYTQLDPIWLPWHVRNK